MYVCVRARVVCVVFVWSVCMYVCVLATVDIQLCVFQAMVSVQVCVCFRPWSVSKYVCV